MFNFLVKKCIKDYQNTQDPLVRAKYGYLGATYGLIINIFLVIFKVTVGLVFHSFALIADGLNNLSDCMSNFICIFGFNLSKKPADKKHPYGHQKIEYIASLMISFVILGLSILTVYQASTDIYDFFSAENFSWFIQPYSQTELILTPIVLSVSILLKLSMVRFSFFLGNKINSLSLKAIGKDSLNDVILTSSILLGFIITCFTHISFDSYLAILVSAFVFYSGIKVFLDASNQLIGLAPEKEYVEQLVKNIKSFKGVLGVHDLEIRSYNEASFFGSVHIEVDEAMSLVDAHSLMDDIEHYVKINNNINLVTHVDPISVNNKKADIFRKRITELLNEYDKNINFHDFRLVVTNEFIKVIFDCLVDISKENLSKKERHALNKMGYMEYLHKYKIEITNYLEEKYKQRQFEDYEIVEFVVNVEPKESYILSQIEQ